MNKAFDTLVPPLMVTKTSTLRPARSIFVHALGILNFHGDTHKMR